MLVKLLVLCCLVASCVGWLAPQRCAQTKVVNTTSTPITLKATTPSSITELAAKQQEDLEQTYIDRKFVSIPVRAEINHTNPLIIEVEAPINCSFTTYEPRLLSSVACDGVSCKLSHTVTTTDTYTASEGYNWGVKLSTKASFFEFIEAGGEMSTGGTYSCTYNKGRTTSDLVECSDNTAGKGHLLLYNIKSDARCNFGQTLMEPEVRDGATTAISYLPEAKIAELVDSALNNTFVINSMMKMFMVDIDKISPRLLNNLKNLFPHYDPFTDFIFVILNTVQVYYLKKTNSVEEYRRVIPFTNENGDSVYQYACTKQPL